MAMNPSPPRLARRGRLAAATLAVAGLVPIVLLAACAQTDDGGGEPGAVPDGDAESQPADTLALPPRTDMDDPGPVDSLALDAVADSLALADSLAVADSLAADGTAEANPTVLHRVPAGTRVRLAAQSDISTDEYAAGDAVIATVTQDVTDGAGTTLIPEGAYFLGRVEASAGSYRVGEPPVLEIAFETLSNWTWERAIETVIVDVAVTLDAQADRARRSAGDRDALVVVPGRIAAGSVIVVQLREPVLVPVAMPLAEGGISGV